MMASLNDVTVWFQEAKPGQKISYHVGNLAFDRYVAKGDHSYNSAEREQKASCCSASRFLMQQYINGNVSLVQRRVEPGVCEYIAIRR